MKKLSLHHRRILDNLARSVMMDISAAMQLYIDLRSADERQEINSTIRERVRVTLGQAHELGMSQRDALPDIPIEKGGLDLGPHLKDLGLAKSDDIIPKVRR